MQKSKDPLEELLSSDSDKLSFLELLNTIHGAASDRRIIALLICIDPSLIIGVGQCEELRSALLKFKETARKPIICYLDSLASWGVNGMRHYYLASVATKIFMSEDGLVHLGPLTIDYPFLQSGLREKLDITVEVRRRSQYKSAGNMFARDGFDEFHREQYEQLIEEMEINFIDTIAKSRHFRPYSAPKNTKTVECIKWIAQQICNEDSGLEFNSMKDDDDKLMNLVHSWSFCGNYKHPKLWVILQFFDRSKSQNVYFEATCSMHTQRGLFFYFYWLSEGGTINSLFASEAKYCFSNWRN